MDVEHELGTSVSGQILAPIAIEGKEIIHVDILEDDQADIYNDPYVLYK